MAANRLRLTSLKLLQKYSACNAYRVQKSLYCTKKSGNEEPPSGNASGFAKFDQKQTELLKEPETPAKESSESFCTEKSGSEEPPGGNASGFAKFDQKQTELLKEPETPAKESSESFCTEKSGNEEPPSGNASGFAKFDKKQTELLKEPETPAKESSESFVSLLKNSNFISMGDPVGKVVIGKIYHVVGNDLYIDFGWKFPTVCTAPERNKEFYVVGTKVRLLIKDLELSAKFLGGEEEITLCEADCVLLGLLNRPSSSTRTKVVDSVS